MSVNSSKDSSNIVGVSEAEVLNKDEQHDGAACENAAVGDHGRPCDGTSNEGERKSSIAYGYAAQYWDGRYTSDKADPFEWLLPYEDLRDLIEEVTGGNRTSRILHVGCGNSVLTEHMYDDGYLDITNVDASPIAINQMLARNVDRPQMKWLEMDVTSMTFEDAAFDVVLDKGTLDTLAIANFDKLASASDSQLLASAHLQDVKRVMRQNATFLCISFGGPDERLKHFDSGSVMQPIRYVHIPSKIPPKPFTRDIGANHAYIYCKRSDAAV